MWYSTVGFLMTLTLSLARHAARRLTRSRQRRSLGSVCPRRPHPLRPQAPPPFVQGLRDLGYVEGQHIAFAYRYAAGNLEPTPRPQRPS